VVVDEELDEDDAVEGVVVDEEDIMDDVKEVVVKIEVVDFGTIVIVEAVNFFCTI
jgi:hypothetical protein